jgi:adenylate cyclase
MLQILYDVDGRPQVYTLVKDEVMIGRSSENDIVLNDFSVSRRHARIAREQDHWVVYDNQSTNGIRVNDQFVPQAVIGSGDVISVGTFVLNVRDEPAGAGVERKQSSDSTSTFIRPLSEFNQDFGLEKDMPLEADMSMDRKRGILDVAYKNKVFEILVQVAKTLISADDLETVLEKVMDIIFEYLPVERGFLLLLDEQGEPSPRVARVKSMPARRPTGEGETPYSRTIVDMVITQRVAILTSDALADERFDMGQSIRMQNIRSAMCVPLWNRGQVIGVIHVDSPLHVGTFTSEDLDLLTALGNFAAVAIERARLHSRVAEERKVRARLERYHSPAVIEEIIRDAKATGSISRVRTHFVTILFVDLVGFTTLSERMAPDALANLLTQFFTYAAEAVFAEGGTLDKFIGDAAMAFFGAPIDQEDHALRAVSAAQRILHAIAQWNLERKRAGESELQVRIAINSGEAVVGEIGSDRRVDYTVLGNTVNVAARIEEFVATPGDVVIGPETYERVKGRFQTIQLGFFALKGLTSQIPLYKVAPQPTEAPAVTATARRSK